MYVSSCLGDITRIAGNGASKFMDGPSAEASFQGPNGLVLDFKGRVVVSDSIDNRVRAVLLPSTLCCAM